MKKLKILGIVCLMVAIVLAVLAQTKPEKAAHYEAMKKEIVAVVDSEMNSNPQWKELATLGTMKVLNAMDGFLQRYLLVYEHTFYNVGVVVYEDKLIPVSVGVAGQV